MRMVTHACCCRSSALSDLDMPCTTGPGLGPGLGRQCERLASFRKDLEKLGMWEPLQGLLASPSDDVKVQALWVIGTAVQNNPAAQKAVRASSPLPTSFRS